MSLLVSSTAASAASLTAYPVTSDGLIMRYNRGVPTGQRDDKLATITVTPLPLNRGRLAFAVAAFNKSSQPINLGIENIDVSLSDGTQLRVLSHDDLVRQAKNRARWAQFGMALATGLAGAAVAANAGRHTYNGTMATPYGYYRYSGTYVNGTEQALATAATTAGGMYAIASIQQGLDDLVANLGESVLQTTTVDQGAGYGGNIVLDKIRWKPTKGSKGKLTDQQLKLTVTIQGKPYPFEFDIR